METVIIILIVIGVAVLAFVFGRRAGDDGGRTVERIADSLADAESGLDEVDRERARNIKRLKSSKERSERIDELVRELAKRRSQTKD